MDIEVKSFGQNEGTDYEEIFIIKKSKFKMSFSNLGARINSWSVPMEDGKFKNIILGYENAQHVFATPKLFYGATIGRVAGRIKNGEVKLKEKTYQLTKNDNENHLHGGNNSFDLKKWDYQILSNDDNVKISFEYEDNAGSNGYPGTMKIKVIHTVYPDNRWKIDYYAKTDEETIFNPTNHVYFNLNGNNSKDIKNHLFQINADYYLPVTEANLPIGKILPVEGTPFDLRKPIKFKDLFHFDNNQFNLHKGFDHAFILNNRGNHAELSHDTNGYKVRMKTTEPCFVVHTHNNTPYNTSIWGHKLRKYSGVAFEAQKEPDALNHKKFHSILLQPNEQYESQTTYKIEKS